MDKHVSAIIILNMVLTVILVFFYYVRPKTINPMVGYRTKRSSKNQSNWEFAQSYFFNNWLILLPIIYITQLLLYIGQVPYSIFGYIILSEFIIGSCVLIYSTERKLIEKENEETA